MYAVDVIYGEVSCSVKGEVIRCKQWVCYSVRFHSCSMKGEVIGCMQLMLPETRNPKPETLNSKPQTCKSCVVA